MKTKIQYVIRVTAIVCILYIIRFFISTPVQAQSITNDTLNSNELVVTSYEELKSALASNNGITRVYFGANITMKATGINIHSSKTDVVISGMNPLDPDQTEPYTLTDYSSATSTDTIYINSSEVKSLLVSDLNIVGKNYYGSFSATDTSVTNDLVITYQRVNYSGPQIVYHRRGLTHFIDSSVSINGANGGSENHEFAETKHLKFEGENTINFQTVTWGVFWYTNTTSASHGTFEIVDNSSLNVTANKRNTASTAYGIFAALGGFVDITIGENAVFNIETNSSINGLSSGSAAYITSMTVNKGGAFNLKTTAAATNVVMQINGALSLSDNASFTINGYGGTSQNLLVQRDGDITVGADATFHLVTGNAYSSLLMLYGRSLICNDPASVLLYNPLGRVIQATTTAGSISVNAEQINYWTAAGTGGFEDIPDYQWKKADGSNFSINGTIAVGTSGNFTSLTSNYTEGDSPGTAPTPESFNMVSARVLSFGRLDLIIYELNDQSTAISGTTTPGATVRASFTQNEVNHVLPDVVADANGFYSIPIDTPLMMDAAVIVRGNYQYLNVVASVLTKPAPGKIEMTVPENLIFETTPLASGAQMARRSDSDWSITVTDTRGTGGGWRLYVRAAIPLTLSDSTDSILNDALVYVNDTDTVTHLNSAVEVSVYRHITGSNSDITVIRWDPNRGIMALIPPETISIGNYTGTLEWILSDVP